MNIKNKKDMHDHIEFLKELRYSYEYGNEFINIRTLDAKIKQAKHDMENLPDTAPYETDASETEEEIIERINFLKNGIIRIDKMRIYDAHPDPDGLIERLEKTIKDKEDKLLSIKKEKDLNILKPLPIDNRIVDNYHF